MKNLPNILADFPQGLSAAELERLGGVSRSTLNRRLKEAVEDGSILLDGKGAAIRYYSADPLAAIRGYFQKPFTERASAPYREDRLDIEPGVSADNLARLNNQNFRALDKRYLSQFLIDFSCASSVLEGGTYSLLDSQSLIEYGERNKGKPLEDAYLVLNHKDAFEYLYENQQLGAIFPVHALLTNDHELPALAKSIHFLPKHDRGVAREYGDVNVKGSSYLPPFRPGTGYIGKTLDLILDRAANIENPVQAAFYLLTRLPYLQPFQDGNKRTARAMCNVPLLQAGMSPISFVDFGKQDYIVAMLAFYELGDTRLAEKCFVDAYLRSQERLVAARDEKNLVISGQHSGEILSIEGGLVIQKVGRKGETVAHELRRLQGDFGKGDVVDISYRDGVGVVGGLAKEIER